jgi:hypothetical protein
MTTLKDEAWHRRHAIMLASQLPECTDDALIILRLTTQLVTSFLMQFRMRPKSPLRLSLSSGETRHEQ